MKAFYNTKKILTIFIFIISAFFTGSVVLLSNITSASAVSDYYGTNTVTVTNGNFTDYKRKSNGTPFKIDSGWTAGENTSNSVSTGIITIDEEDFESEQNNKFGLPVNPKADAGCSDDYMLMIKAKDGTSAQYYYVSDEISLTNGKFYELSIHCKTGLRDENDNIISGTDGFASIYTSLSDAKNFTSINTSGRWQTYNFYIATDSFETAKFTIELRLGSLTSSSGIVFFDQVQIKEIASQDYAEVVNKLAENNTAYNSTNLTINLDTDYVDGFMTNPSFEESLNGWVVGDSNDNTEIIANAYNDDSINSLINEKFNHTSSTDLANNFILNSKKLLLLNADDAKNSIKTAASNTIKILQHSYYRLSMYVKTGDISNGGLNVTLAETDGDLKLAQTSLTSSTNTIDAYNNYVRVDFFIKGSVTDDVNLSLELSLGNSDTKVKGWAIIDEISLQKVNQSEYDDQGTSSTKLDLAQNTKDTSNIENGSFNFVSNTSSTVTYPAQPAKWDALNGTEKSGIIRVNSSKFESDTVTYNYGLTAGQNPGPNTSYYALKGITISPLTTTENVLMVRNSSTEDAGFKSTSDVTLDKNSNTSDSLTISKFEVAVKTLDGSKAFIKLVDSEDNIIAVIDEISSDEWTNYSIYVKGGITIKNVYMILGTHGDGENRYAFFDYVKLTPNISEDFDLQTVLSDEHSAYYDLMNNTFYSHSNKTVRNNIYELNGYEVYATEEDKASALYHGITRDVTVQNTTEKNVLVITNTVASYQVLKSLNFSLEQGNYYEISILVKTDFSGCVNAENYGAYIELVSIEDGELIFTADNDNSNRFVNIVTASSPDTNGWIKYSLYIYAENTNVSCLLFGLGNSDNSTKGTAYFDDIVVKDVSLSEYAKQESGDTTIVSKVVTDTSSDNDEDDKTNSSSTTTDSGVNIWALLSSIILVIALVLAIAGYLIRRIPKKAKPANVEKSTYTRTKPTIDEKAVRDELKLTREEKVAAANQELESLKAERNKLQAEYEAELEQKDNNSNKESLYVTYTKKLNKLDKQINYLSSAVRFATDNENIKVQEIREIKKRKKELAIQLQKEEEALKQPIEDEQVKKTAKKKPSPKKNSKSSTKKSTKKGNDKKGKKSSKK